MYFGAEMYIRVSLWMFYILHLQEVDGHGRLLEPPSRASAWRSGFGTPVNYQDNELFCGGFGVQTQNGGKCGICGDPWQGPREHEAGGKFATDTIVRHYHQADVMEIMVQLTANHKGWFEFRLCPNNDPSSNITQECLDDHLLEMADGSGTRFTVTPTMRDVTLQMHLPEYIVCTQCVLQWKYNTGNSWGYDADGTGCVGCGSQEQFYGCADIAIIGNAAASSTTITTGPRTTSVITTTQKPTSTSIVNYSTSSAPQHQTSGTTDCTPVGQWKIVPGMYNWCATNCAAGRCPTSHCICSANINTGEQMVVTPNADCKPVGLWTLIPGMESWCQIHCVLTPCSGQICRCGNI